MTHQPHTPPLSATAAERGEAILVLAQREARRRRLRRQTSRVLAGAGVVVVVAALLITLPWGDAVRPTPPTPTAALDRSPRVRPLERAAVVVAAIETDPTILDRLAVESSTLRAQPISDEQLLVALADAGQPAGLAYVNGQAHLLFHGQR